MKTVGFVGVGNMAKAIIKGMINSNFDAIITGYDKYSKSLEGVNAKAFTYCDDLNKLVSSNEYIFLSVKPQTFTEVLGDIKAHINKNSVIISIAAGISSDFIKAALGYDAKIVTVMPNTPLLLGYGASALSKDDNVSEEEFSFIKSIFDCAGISEVISKDKMKEIIAVNGSTPAFIYEFTAHFINFAKSKGIDEKVALNLFSQTLIGSAKMMTDSGYSIQELTDMVSSKGGTTIAGLNSFRENNFDKVVNDACEACVNRAYELAK